MSQIIIRISREAKIYDMFFSKVQKTPFFIKVDDRGFLMLTKEEQEAEHLTVNANG